MKITYAFVHLNRLDELKKCVKHYSPYVDRIIVSDGESADGSLEWLKNTECDVETIVKKQYRMPYGDHTPEARDPYLKQAGSDGWLLVTDTDEYIEKDALPALRKLAEKAEELGYDEVRFQARDIWTYETGEVYDNLANYWKEGMFVKMYPGMKYQGHTHSGLYRPGAINKWVKSGFIYTHEKTERQMWKNSTFLYWTTCGVAQNRTDSPVWKEFHELMDKDGYQDWHELNKYMEGGHISYAMKDWFIEHKDAENPEEAAWFIYYFIFLHPEENVDKISCERHERYTWDYLSRANKK